MFVSSSLERIPQRLPPIGKSTSFTQVNTVNGNSSEEDGERCLHRGHPTTSSSSQTSSSATSSPCSDSVATENKTTTESHSPTTTTTPRNSAAASDAAPFPATRSTCHVKPLAETHIENNVEENITDKTTRGNSATTENIDRKNGETLEQNSSIDSEEEIRAQVTTKISPSSSSSTPTTVKTPSSTYSRYDIYRWRERPFGPSYRRKERQRREQELMEQNKNMFNSNQNNERSEGQNEEKEDSFHPFINRFTSPQTFYEEEYSYEPEKQISSMKTVLRTRSMINLDGDDGRVLVRKTLSDANLDQDKNSNFSYRFNHERNKQQNNRTTEKHHYFGYLDLPHRYEEKRDLDHIFQQKKQTQDNEEYHQEFNNNDEGNFRQRLRELLVNNELIIQPKRNQPLDTPTNRRCFYHPVRINRELIDEELPDPDQVKLARDRFEKVLKIKGPEVPKGLQRTSSIPPGQRITPEVRIPLTHSNTLPAKITTHNEKWTDTGSLSSGISSASEDVEDQLHEVSSEVLQKIRACGTTVTYYGGKVIAQSHGPPSPLTSTIMEEIKFRLEVRDRLPFQEY